MCTSGCFAEAAVCDLRAPYVKHLDKKSRFTRTGPQLLRAHINLQKARPTFVKEQIAMDSQLIPVSFVPSCDCVVKGGLFLCDCFCLAVLVIKKQEGVNIRLHTSIDRTLPFGKCENEKENHCSLCVSPSISML